MDWKQELIKRLDALAAQLGTTGAYLWEVLVRQAKISGYTDLGCTVFLGALTYAGYKMARILWDKHEEDGGYAVGAVLIGCVSVGISIWTVVTLQVAVLELSNPSYYALEKILQTVGK